MATKSQQTEHERASESTSALAKPLAPEEIRTGDFVSLLHVIYEVPSFLWDCGVLPRDEPVRIRYVPEQGGVPLKVKSVCLPFVLVKHPAGGKRTLDVRRCRLARLDRKYARAAWSGCRKKLAQFDCR